MSNNTNIPLKPESYLDGFPGIELVNKEGKLAIEVNRNSLPAHCQYELVEAAFNLLEKTPDCERPEELAQSLSTYLTTTKKPIGIESIKNTWQGRVINLISVFAILYFLFYGICLLAAIAIPPLPILGVVLGAVLLGTGLIWLGDRGMNTVKSENQLKDLIQEINSGLEQASQKSQNQESQHAANVINSSPEVSNKGASGSRKSSVVFFPGEKADENKDHVAAQASNGECSGVAHVMSQGRH